MLAENRGKEGLPHSRFLNDEKIIIEIGGLAIENESSYEFFPERSRDEQFIVCEHFS